MLSNHLLIRSCDFSSLACLCDINVIIYFDTQLVINLWSGNPFRLLSVLTIYAHLSLSVSLKSNTTRCSGLILYFPYTRPGRSHFSKDLWGMYLETRDLGSRLFIVMPGGGGGRCSQTSFYISVSFTLVRTVLLCRQASHYTTHSASGHTPVGMLSLTPWWC